MKLVFGQAADVRVLDSTWCGVCAAKRAHSISAGVGNMSESQWGLSGSFWIVVQYCS
jgi:hypothetical protein